MPSTQTTNTRPSTLLGTSKNGPGFEVPGYDGPMGLGNGSKPQSPAAIPRDTVQLSPASQGPVDSALDVSNSVQKMVKQALSQGLRRRW